MAFKLYVGNLNYKTTEDDLRAAFEQAGAVVAVQVMMDRISGRPRGFGFVEMETEEGMTKSIDMWNGKELDGRALRVNEAKPLEDRPPRTGGFRGGNGGGFRGGNGGGFRGGNGGGFHGGNAGGFNDNDDLA